MRATASARAIARLLTVCAVLAGLFLMHGLPAQACPGGTGMQTTVATAAPMAGHGAERVLTAPEHHETFAAAHAGMPEHGTACVFTLDSRGIDVLLALLLLAAGAALGWPTQVPKLGGRWNPRTRRAPPRAGMDLLTTLCVSRT